MKKKINEILSKYNGNKGYTMHQSQNELFDLLVVSQQRELLLAFLKCYNNGEVTKYTEKEVDDFLKHNSI